MYLQGNLLQIMFKESNELKIYLKEEVMKIFFTIDYKISGRGGMETVISDMTLSLLQLNHDVTIILAEKSEDPLWEEILPIDYLYNQDQVITFENEEERFMDQVNIIKNKISADSTPDVIVTLSPFATKVARESVDSLKECTSVITWLHFSLYRIRNWEMISYAHGHIGISQGLINDLNKEAPATPSILVSNPVSFGKNTIPRPDTTTEFLFVGRLYNYQKRIDILFKALSRVIGDWHLTLVGDGKDEVDLKLLANQLMINDKITWVGWKEHPWSFIDKASTLLLTSDYEGFGLVLVEALSRGIPVISSDCDCGPSDIVVHGQNGWLFTPGKDDQLAELLNKIVNKNIKLPEAEICINSVSHLEIDRVSRKFVEAIYELSSSRKSSINM